MSIFKFTSSFFKLKKTSNRSMQKIKIIPKISLSKKKKKIQNYDRFKMIPLDADISKFQIELLPTNFFLLSNLLVRK